MSMEELRPQIDSPDADGRISNPMSANSRIPPIDPDLPIISGWGRVPVNGSEVCSTELERLTKGAVLCRGLGRSYGDSALPPAGHPVVAGTRYADRLLSFDEATGLLRAEAGLSLTEINRLFLRRRWFTPVTPGTHFVTLGGMVASDVHGKNHHVERTFGQHVTRLKMRLADDRIIECEPDLESDLFWATVGGMGLTGHILEVEFRMRRIPSPWIFQEVQKWANLDEMIAAMIAAKDKWPYTVGWIDCLARGENMGRGLLMCGRWAEVDEAPLKFPKPKPRLRVPFEFPAWVLGPWSVKLFNMAYYSKQFARVKTGVVDPETFFYPLDAIRDWNKIYGKRGFTQYQCVLPEKDNPGATKRFLDLFTKQGGASFLSVIKDCGEQGDGLLSFPMPGISIASDIKVTKDTPRLVDELNELVLAEGGRIYLTKDTFTTGEHYRAMDPRFERWQEIRRKWDPEGRLRSAQSVRMFGDQP